MEVSKIVPQFFYDVIARVIPGSAVILGVSLGIDIEVVSLVTFTVQGTPDFISSSIFFVATIFSYSYVLGHIISPIGDLLSKKVFEKLYNDSFHVLRNCTDSNKSKYPKKIQEYIKKEVAFDDNSENKNAEYTSVLFVWADWLRLRSPDAGARIVKLRAEYRMYIGLTVAALLALFSHLMAAYSFNIEINPVFVVVCMFVSYLGGKGHCKSYSTFQWSVVNNYYAAKVLCDGVENA